MGLDFCKSKILDLEMVLSWYETYKSVERAAVEEEVNCVLAEVDGEGIESVEVLEGENSSLDAEAAGIDSESDKGPSEVRV